MGRKRSEVDTTEYSGRMAKRLLELREAKGMTTEKLATKLGVPLSTAYAWEAGTLGINPDLYPAIAKALGVPIAELFPAK